MDIDKILKFINYLQRYWRIGKKKDNNIYRGYSIFNLHSLDMIAELNNLK